MEAYKFDVKIQKNGVIEIPEISQFADQEAEVFIMLKSKAEIKANLEAVEKFLTKWRGLLKDADPDKLKLDYLQEKYG